MATERVPSDGPRLTFADGTVRWLSAVPCCRQFVLSATPTGLPPTVGAGFWLFLRTHCADGS